VIVPHHAAEPLAARYLAGGGAHFLARLDQSVIEPLVIALCGIIGYLSSVAASVSGVYGKTRQYNCLRLG
jgi:hypothetical protein